MPDIRYNPDRLKQFCKDLLMASGFTIQDAEVTAKSLVRAELEGSSSHGISRLAIYYRRIKEGRIVAKPDIRLEPVGAVLKVDGGNGLGQVVASRALEAAIPIAEAHGIAGVFIRGSNHFGTAAYYCQQACEAGMAMIAFTNSPPGIAPWGGKQAYLGTNPIAFGFPTRTEPPVMIDMSSSVTARGNIILANKKQEQIPPGWAIDAEGLETTDPAEALKGAMLPLGGAKGYALAMAVEMMAAILSGAAFGPHVHNLYKDEDPPANVGHSFILLNMTKWMDSEEYYTTVERFLTEIKMTPPAQGVEEILYPGERRYRTYLDNRKHGVCLSAQVVSELTELGDSCGIIFPAG